MEVGFASNTADDALAEAAKSATVTHDHPEGVKGAQAVGSEHRASAVLAVNPRGNANTIGAAGGHRADEYYGDSGIPEISGLALVRTAS